MARACCATSQWRSRLSEAQCDEVCEIWGAAHAAGVVRQSARGPASGPPRAIGTDGLHAGVMYQPDVSGANVPLVRLADCRLLIT